MTGTLAHIFRHPIKAYGREELGSVELAQGKCLPWDRHWAVAHDAAKLRPGWNPCMNFSRGAKAPGLMAITAQLDEETEAVTLSHPKQGEITFHPGNAEDLPRFLEWAIPLNPAERALPANIISAGRGMTDSDFPSISILSLSSLKELSAHIGHDLSVHRWRGNLWIDGAQPFEEFGWIGKKIRIGDTLLEVQEPITRCKATMANPTTGQIDADTLGALSDKYDHRDFGIYATVVEGGKIRQGDTWKVV